VKQAERDAGARQDGGLTSTERHELSDLRRENRRLREDVDILSRRRGVHDVADAGYLSGIRPTVNALS
jgi:transposase-like protein